MRNHEENRSKVCLLCFRKATTAKPISKMLKSIIIQNFIPYYCETDSVFPKVLCSSCYAMVYRFLKGKEPLNFVVHDYPKDKSIETRSSSDHSNCNLCKTARQTIFPKRSKHCTQKSPSPKTCAFCLTVISRGKRHKCTKRTKLQNIENIAEDCRDQFAASVIRKKSSTKKDHVALSNQYGKPTSVKIVRNTSQQNENQNPITHGEVLQWKSNLNLSMKKVSL